MSTNQFIPMSEIDTSQIPKGETLVCNWFALCDKEAIGVVTHAILGGVLVCQKCAELATEGQIRPFYGKDISGQ